jgi:hypothetical protein
MNGKWGTQKAYAAVDGEVFPDIGCTCLLTMACGVGSHASV